LGVWRLLDFGLGRTLGRNFGVVTARKEVYVQVIEAVQAVLAESAAQGEGRKQASYVSPVSPDRPGAPRFSHRL
jgi:hypothetical protein